MGLNKVAIQKTANIPHHVLTRIKTPEKSFFGCFLLVKIKMRCTQLKLRKIIPNVQRVDITFIPPTLYFYCIIKDRILWKNLKEGNEMTSKTFIYILLTDTGTLFTKSIKKYTKAPYNHASIAFDAHLTEMYSFGRKNPNNPINGGFVKEDIHTGTYSKYPETTCVIYKLEVTSRDVEKMRRVLNVFIKNQKRFLYNLIGVLGVSLNEPVEFSNSYFCSQFVAEMLHRSGIKLWDKLPALVTPDDFRKNPHFQLVYEGKLTDYPLIKK